MTQARRPLTALAALLASLALASCQERDTRPPPPRFADPQVARPQEKPPQKPAAPVDPIEAAIRKLSLAVNKDEPVFVVPRGAAVRVIEGLTKLGVEHLALEDNGTGSEQYFAQRLISRVRWKQKIWVAYDHSQQTVHDTLRDYFIADHNVTETHEFGDITVFRVVNELSADESSRPIQFTEITRPGGMITGIEFTSDGKSMFTAAKYGGVMWHSMDDPKHQRMRVLKIEQSKDGSEGLFTGGESGLIGLALHPEFPATPKIYTHYNYRLADGSREARVSEWVLEPAAPGWTARDERIFFRNVQEHDNHNGGQILFGPDGYLYIGVGDGEIGKWLIGRSAPELMRGKIFRIDTNSRTGDKGYGIPADNPFVGHDVIPPETWAWGFRNPWRMTFLPDGRLIVGEIGEDKNEELTFALRGRHHGWPYVEGRYFRNEWALGDEEPQPPLHVYGRTRGMSVIGGQLYTGDAIAWLSGKFVFCDYMSGRIWALDVPDDTNVTVEIDELMELGRWPKLITTWGKDPAGNIYAGDHAGVIYVIEENTGGATSESEFDPAMARAMFSADPPEPGARELPVAEVELGRMLYADARIARDRTSSCATCHPLDNFGQDGRRTSPGAERNAPSTFNAHLQFSQFWDYRATTVEDAVRAHGLAQADEVGATLRNANEYSAPFRVAFPGQAEPRTAENAVRAIGAFVRTLETRSRWDEFVDGKDDALTVAEQAGLTEFINTGCVSCHMGRTLGGGMPQKLGLALPWNGEDRGHGALKNDSTLDWFFKVTPLRNVGKTAPYYHDGSIATLEEAVANMAKVQLNRDLSEEQAKSIATFLRALTGAPPVSAGND